jgi:hypothetical protein
MRHKDLGTIKQYLKSLASGEEECFRMKLMLVGAENVGKTTTSRILREEISFLWVVRAASILFEYH